jgi:hypothetical protein
MPDLTLPEAVSRQQRGDDQRLVGEEVHLAVADDEHLALLVVLQDTKGLMFQCLSWCQVVAAACV